MSILLSCRSLTKSYGPRPLFTDVALGVSDGERLGLIGPNGSGKSTLLKILAGVETPDEGEVTRRKGVRVGYAPQADAFPPGATPRIVVVDALRDDVGTNDDDRAHERETRAEMVLGRLGFTLLDQSASDLSGGWRKRLSLARELAREPDLLLLDEPTNHLDVEGILWLEDLLDDARFAVVVVTHDRYFLEEVPDRIVELNAAYPGGTFAVDGPYSEFIEARAAFLDAQASQEANLRGRVRDDIAWLKRGARARRTKAKGRIDSANTRMAALADLERRNAPPPAAAIEFGGTGRRTRDLLVAEGISKSLGGRLLFAGIDLTLGPGACLGLLGPNGSGKTTLIQVLTGALEPDTGVIKRAAGLRVATFTQDRGALDLRQPLRKALCPEGDTVIVRGEGVHVSSWARRFLFRPEQLDVTVRELSGGEHARILIAELMRQPADVLILDEPTNDLDIASLEVLEQSLQEFPGAVLLVTHDRFMLDRLSTQVLGLDGKGGARLVADVSQWLAAREADAERVTPTTATAKPAPRTVATGERPGRLTYNEQREWGQIETRIEAAEARAAELEQRMHSPELLADHAALHEHYRQLEAVHAEVAALYERWAELDSRRSPPAGK